MRVFKDVGLVEQLGSGMSRILKYYDRDIFEISDHFIKVVFPFSLSIRKRTDLIDKKNGLDCVVGYEGDIVNDIENGVRCENDIVNDTENGVRCENDIVNLSRNIKNIVNNKEKNEQIILPILEATPSITIRIISENTGFSNSKVNRIIKKLKQEGKIERRGSDKKGYWIICK